MQPKTKCVSTTDHCLPLQLNLEGKALRLFEDADLHPEGGPEGDGADHGVSVRHAEHSLRDLVLNFPAVAGGGGVALSTREPRDNLKAFQPGNALDPDNPPVEPVGLEVPEVTLPVSRLDLELARLLLGRVNLLEQASPRVSLSHLLQHVVLQLVVVVGHDYAILQPYLAVMRSLCRDLTDGQPASQHITVSM
jgi:hypothetical protein